MTHPCTARTDRPWWTITDAARLLRINQHTLYRACARGDFPAKKVGNYWRIPAEALGMRVDQPPTRVLASRTYHLNDDPDQLELPLDPRCLVPVKVWRNSGEPIPHWNYEHNLWRVDDNSRKSVV